MAVKLHKPVGKQTNQKNNNKKNPNTWWMSKQI